MALIDLVLLRLAFSVLVCVCLSVSMYRTEKRRYACLVPDDGGTKDASVERLEFCRLVFCTLVIGLGHVEVSLRVGDPFCLYRQRAGWSLVSLCSTYQTGQRAWRSCPSPTLQPVSPAPPHF